MTQQTTISGLLQSEHRWIDGYFQQFRRHLAEGRVTPDPFEKAAKALHRHIYLEEEVLFPEVEARGLMGPTAVMAQEHGQICRFLGDIGDLIRSKATPPRIVSAFQALCSLLEEHNGKEEQVLYPWSDQLLGQQDRAQVLQRLREANPPQGWACRAHRAGSM